MLEGVVEGRGGVESRGSSEGKRVEWREEQGVERREKSGGKCDVDEE